MNHKICTKCGFDMSEWDETEGKTFKSYASAARRIGLCFNCLNELEPSKPLYKVLVDKLVELHTVV